ncbi:MAG: MaoC family dehydratase [Pyrinomonadaceae bacterium]
MPARELENLAQLRGLVGQEVAASDWLAVTQERIEQFAEATEDRQWIHVDAARAAHESPFGGTIAHGFLTLSLIAGLMERSLAVSGLRMAINYGLNRVRFVAPVPSGARVRARFLLASLEEVKGGAQQATWKVNLEREGDGRTCCVAEWLVRYYSEVTSDE